MSLEPVDERYYNRKGESNRVDTLGDQNYPNKGCMPPPINPLDDVSSGYVRKGVSKDPREVAEFNKKHFLECAAKVSNFSQTMLIQLGDNLEKGGWGLSNQSLLVAKLLVLVAGMILGFILRWWLG